jgi:4-aminobutyrate aminotransferase-like enzyme/Ser/Thr protein kinase RdoA (MazF antagonist)
MKELVERELGIQVTEIKELNGYSNKNYLIKSNNESYIFKTYPFNKEVFSFIKAENSTLLFLSQNPNSLTPIPISFKDGTYVKKILLNEELLICRPLSFLEGDFLAEVNPSEKLVQSLGLFLAKMDLELEEFDDFVIKSRQCEWDIQHLLLNEKYIEDIPDAKDRNTVRYFFKQFEENVGPVLPELRKSFIHSDANEWNILVKNDEIAGIIDFGDMAYSPLINELATAMAYMCYDKDDLFTYALPLIKAYNKVLPLQKKEIGIIYYLMAAKLCISVCQSSHAKKKNPDNTYASVSEKNAWRMLYAMLKLNPLLVENTFLKELGFKETSPEPIGVKLQERRKYVSKVLSVSYDEPISMVKSAFQYMYDAYGNTYLDAYNNIPHVGHSHPVVVEAGQRQMAQLNTNTRYLYDALPEYAEQLLSKFPAHLNKVFFVNSGSEANDLAIRMAKAHTGYEQIMVMEHGYHGHTQTGIDISDYKFNHPKGQGKRKHILKTAIPNTYNGKYTGQNSGPKYAEDAITEIKNSTNSIAAFICEPIVGCGGQIPLAEGYLDLVYQAIRSQKGLCISDEVQTGFGRLGNCFWGYEQHNVVPDIVVLGKPMGNGHPIGAVITTSEISASFEEGVEFFSSFGGNPVSCAIGKAVLEVIEEEKLQKNAQTTGEYYKSLFTELKNIYSCIGDVRGSGLFLGIELIDEAGNPNPKLAQLIKNELRKRHVLISTDGPYNNVIKTKPPLVFTQQNALQVVEEIDRVITRNF